MRSKVTVVLLFLNVVLFFYIFNYEEKWKAEQKTLEARRRVLGPEAAAIDSLTRTMRNGPTVKLERRNDTWWLSQPYDWPANANAVSRITNELQFLEHDTSFAVADLAKSGQTLADYGLTDPAITLSFTSAGKAYTLKIGDDTKIGNRLYVLSADGTRIHVVGRSLADTTGMPLDEIRADSIFTVPVFEVRSLNLQAAAPSNLKVRLRRDAAARWSFEAPINARASKSAVEVTINTLNGLKAKNFLDPKEADPERTGLGSPAVRVTLEGNARRETLLLGKPAGATVPASGEGTLPHTEYFAKVEDKAVAFTVDVPEPLLAVLRTAQEALRDPHVLDFEPDTVTSLVIAAPGQPELTLQKLEAGASGSAGGWQAVVRLPGQVPQTTTADTAIVEDLLQKLKLLSAHDMGKDRPRFVSDAPSAADLEDKGFNRPEREITLNLNTGGGLRGNEPSAQTLQVGISPGQAGQAFARVTGAPFVYRILPDILDQAPASARYFRQRLLRELPDSARITTIKLADLATGQVYYQVHNEHAVTFEGLAKADQPEATLKVGVVLLAQIRTLKAKRFVAETFSTDHADTPQGTQPWKYRLDTDIVFAGGAGDASNTTSTLYLTERIGGTTLYAGTAEFGGVEFEVTPEMLQAVFAFTYAAKNDPGVPAAPEADAAKEKSAAPKSGEDKAATPPADQPAPKP
ncbi:MAG TPA: DUF4340 domain-containing protein [Lacunisphaera sp.]|nr:DUF4340 domain-containing protein [Lacunisphaera sp.]